MSARFRRGVLVVVAVLLVLGGLLPLLRAGAAQRDRAWTEACARAGGRVETLPAPQRNPLVVQTGHEVQQCRSATGAVLSRRD